MPLQLEACLVAITSGHNDTLCFIGALPLACSPQGRGKTAVMFACVVLSLVSSLRQPQRLFFSERFVNISE